MITNYRKSKDGEYHADELNNSPDVEAFWYGTIARNRDFEFDKIEIEDWLSAAYGYMPKIDRTKVQELIKLRANAVELGEDGKPTQEARYLLNAHKSEQVSQHSTVGTIGDKSVSIAYILLSEEKRKLHDEMVLELLYETLDKIEKDVLYEVNEKTGKQFAQGVLIGVFKHYVNRAGLAGGPFPHYHIEFINSCLTRELTNEDKEKYQALINDVMVNNQPEHSSSWVIGTMSIWTKLGFEVEPVFAQDENINGIIPTDNTKLKHVVGFKLKNQPKALQKAVKSYSVRENEILEALYEDADEIITSNEEEAQNEQPNEQKELIFTYKQKALAQIQSKDKKVYLSTPELIKEWTKQLSQMGVDAKMIEKMSHIKKKSNVSDYNVNDLINGFVRKHKTHHFREEQFKSYVKNHLGFVCSEERATQISNIILQKYAHNIFTTEKDINDYASVLLDKSSSKKELEQYFVKRGLNLNYVFQSTLRQEKNGFDYFKKNQHSLSFYHDENDIYAFLHKEKLNKSGALNEFLNSTHNLGRVAHLKDDTFAPKIAQFYQEKKYNTFTIVNQKKTFSKLSKEMGNQSQVAYLTHFINQYLNKKITVPNNSVFFVANGNDSNQALWAQFVNIVEKTNSKIIFTSPIESNKTLGITGLHRFTEESNQEFICDITEELKNKETLQRAVINGLFHNNGSKTLIENKHLVVVDTIEEKNKKLAQIYQENIQNNTNFEILTNNQFDLNLLQQEVAKLKSKKKHTFETLFNKSMSLHVGDTILCDGQELRVKEFKLNNKTGKLVKKGRSKVRINARHNVICEVINANGTIGPKAVSLDIFKKEIQFKNISINNKKIDSQKMNYFSCPSNIVDLNLTLVNLTNNINNSQLIVSKEELNHILKLTSSVMKSTEKQKYLVKEVAKAKKDKVAPKDLNNFKFCHAYLETHYYDQNNESKQMPLFNLKENKELELIMNLQQALTNNRTKKSNYEYQVLMNSLDEVSFNINKMMKKPSVKKATNKTASKTTKTKAKTLATQESLQHKMNQMQFEFNQFVDSNNLLILDTKPITSKINVQPTQLPLFDDISIHKTEEKTPEHSDIAEDKKTKVKAKKEALTTEFKTIVEVDGNYSLKDIQIENKGSSRAKKFNADSDNNKVGDTYSDAILDTILPDLRAPRAEIEKQAEEIQRRRIEKVKRDMERTAQMQADEEKQYTNIKLK